MGSTGVCSMSNFAKFSPEYSAIEKSDPLDDGFDRIDSRGVEGSTKDGSVFPKLVDEEPEEIEINTMPFWEALQMCIENDYAITRLAWEDDVFAWVFDGNSELGNTLVTYSLYSGGYTVYTPTQEDIFSEDWFADGAL
jgi:hypothetical protein